MIGGISNQSPDQNPRPFLHSSSPSLQSEEPHRVCIIYFVYCAAASAACFASIGLGGQNLNRMWHSPKEALQFASFIIPCASQSYAHPAVIDAYPSSIPSSLPQSRAVSSPLVRSPPHPNLAQSSSHAVDVDGPVFEAADRRRSTVRRRASEEGPLSLLKKSTGSAVEQGEEEGAGQGRATLIGSRVVSGEIFF